MSVTRGAIITRALILIVFEQLVPSRREEPAGDVPEPLVAPINSSKPNETRAL